MRDDAAVIAATRRWVEETVVGLDLCPFAAAPLARGALRLRLCGERHPDAIYRALLEALEGLLHLPEAEAETELLVVPRGLEAFDDYLEVLYSAEEALAEAGLEGRLQLASFHPDYRFEGAEADDPANYTNRSPWPMFHLLRHSSVSAALAGCPDPGEIPARNVRRLRALGLAEMRRRLAAIRGGAPAAPPGAAGPAGGRRRGG